jgi:hypothetical protein
LHAGVGGVGNPLGPRRVDVSRVVVDSRLGLDVDLVFRLQLGTRVSYSMWTPLSSCSPCPVSQSMDMLGGPLGMTQIWLLAGVIVALLSSNMEKYGMCHAPRAIRSTSPVSKCWPCSAMKAARQLQVQPHALRALTHHTPAGCCARTTHQRAGSVGCRTGRVWA